SKEAWVPIFAEVHLSKAVMVMIDGVVRTKQSHSGLLHFGAVAAEYVDVLSGDLTEHVGQNVIEICPAHHVVHIRLISLRQQFQIRTMQVGVVKEVALNSTDFAEHLLPLGTRIDVHLQGFKMQGSAG